LQRIIRKCIEKDLTRRYQTLSDVATDLDECRRERSRSGALIGGPATRSRFGFTRTFALLAFILAAIGIGAWIIQSGKRTAGSERREATITPLTAFLGSEGDPAFSPDGKQLAFTWRGEKDDNADIYVMQVGAEGLLRLTRDPAIDSSPVWTADGRYITFLRVSNERSGVFLVSALGGGQERRLTDVFPLRPIASGRELAWSGDGTMLAIVDKRVAEEPFSIVLFMLATGDRKQLVAPVPGGVGDIAAAFSPDDKTVAFVRSSGASGQRDIYVVPVSGGEPTRLTFDNVEVWDLDWMPTGTAIMFSSERERARSLWTVPVAGGSPERLTPAGVEIGAFSFEARSKRLVYAPGSFRASIWRLGLKAGVADGRPPTRLIYTTRSDFAPSYSPDAGHIAFNSTRTGRVEIWLSDGEGLNAIQLTNDEGRSGSPRLSPDGKWIVFDSRIDGNANIHVMSISGGQRRRLTDHAAEDVTPSWSRDGRWIYFASRRTGSLEVWKVPAPGGNPTQVTHRGGFNPIESVDGKHVFYAKGRATPGIWALELATGAESLVTAVHNAGYWRSWDVTPRGIYFATGETPDRSILEFHDFATRQVTTIARLAKPFQHNFQGASVSHDGRWLTYMQDEVINDIMLMEPVDWLTGHH
jgi:Tol biopolymer transport system component